MRLKDYEIAEKYEVEKEDVFKAFNKLDNKESILFAMSGKMGAGKDTIGDEIAKFVEDKDFEVSKTSYAEPLRKEISEITIEVEFGVPIDELTDKYKTTEEEIYRLVELIDGYSIYEKTAETRRAMQYWGTDVRRKQNPNYWVNKTVQAVLDSINSGISIYVTDVRFPNEADAIVDLGGKLIRLEVPTSVRADRIGSRDGNRPTEESLAHSSETGLDNYTFKDVFDGCSSIDAISKEVSDYILK